MYVIKFTLENNSYHAKKPLTGVKRR